ncbi:hypothetical protein [Georgenia muralis]
MGLFEVLLDNPVRGVLALDMLYVVSNLLAFLLYLALAVVLWQVSRSAVVVALGLGVLGMAAYMASPRPVEMLTLARAYGEAGPAEQVALVATGDGMLATWMGTAFDIYYFFNLPRAGRQVRRSRAGLVGTGRARGAGRAHGARSVAPRPLAPPAGSLVIGPEIQCSISGQLRRRTTGRSGRRRRRSATRAAVLRWVVQAHRTMCSRSVRIVHSGGSTFPFHSSCRRRRRTTVRTTTWCMTRARGRSTQTRRSARSARAARTEAYCHSVTQDGSATKRCTSASKVGRGVQPGPW